MTFHIGQKVINIHKWRNYYGINAPVFMQIYTVRAYSQADSIPSILLNEIHNREVVFARTNLRGEASFAEKFFRPLEELQDKVETDEILDLRVST